MSSPPAGKPARQLRWNLARKRAKPKRPIKDELWEAHKAEIIELYIVQDKTANEVIAAVSTDEFAPSRRQLTDRLGKWDAKKYERRQNPQGQILATSHTEAEAPSRGSQQREIRPVANALHGTPSPSPGFRSIDDHAEPRTAAEDSTTSPQFDENWQSYNGPGLAYPFGDNYHDFANWDITNDNVFRNDAQFGMFNEPTNDDSERNLDFNAF